MILNYLKTIFRNIFRKRSNAWINILGLSLGLAITLLIWMHVLYEGSYDRFFDDHKNIYRVHNTMTIMSDEPLTMPTSMFRFAERVRDQFPDVVQTTRLTAILPNAVLKVGDDRIIHTPMIAGVDSTFFEVFNLEFLAGNPPTALTEPGSIVLTYSLAESLFETPLLSIGQTVNVYDFNYRVTAIIEDVPENSHLAFNGLIPIVDVPDGMKEGGFGFFTYLKLAPHANIASLEEQFSRIAEEVVLTNPYFYGDDAPVEVHLMNLADIHLNSNLIWEMKDNGSKRNVMIFSAMSVFILLLALINYVNMATARSSLRAKEIGVRKVAGSSRGALIRQFMTESFIFSFLAFALALLFAENFSGFFSSRLGVDIHPGVMFTANGLLVLVALLTFTGIMAGLYPAIYLSSFNPVKVLKGEMVKGKKGQLFRQSLVVLQFAITIFLVSSLLVIAMQLNFMLRQGLGYEKESVLIARSVSIPIRRAFPDVTARLEALEGVRTASGANFLFGETNEIELISVSGTAYGAETVADILAIDDKFIPMLEIHLQEGRNFHAHSELDAQGAAIINQAAVTAMGIEEPLKARINHHSGQMPVIGVVDNFQLKSMHNAVEPLVFRFARRNFNHIYLKLEPGNLAHTRDAISEVFHDFDHTWFPDLVFLDERLQAQYGQERQSANLLSAGSILALVISMLGVYGLAAFAIERRFREIGIRKVLGASYRSLLWNFNKEFFILALIAFSVSAPLAWWAMDGWLSNFVLRVSLNPAWFLLPALVTLVMSASIISIQVGKAARANPVESLKTE
jgi:putative ABC transport system permease protein